MRFIKISLVIIIILLVAILTMGIKHKDVKASGDKGFATEWNDDHVIDGDVDFAGHAINNDTTIAIRTGTHYWSCPGINFKASPSTRDIRVEHDEGWVYPAPGEVATNFYAPVFLPHGATVTSVIVKGDAPGETWELRRWKIVDPGASSSLASAPIDAEDNTITNPVIDNENYAYFFQTSTINAENPIEGARIKYTL